MGVYKPAVLVGIVLLVIAGLYFVKFEFDTSVSPDKNYYVVVKSSPFAIMGSDSSGTAYLYDENHQLLYSQDIPMLWMSGDIRWEEDGVIIPGGDVRTIYYKDLAD